jgi:hypothetical protein
MRLRYCVGMKQARCGGGVVAAFLVLTACGPGRAQSSIDILEKELDQTKQQHEAATSQAFANFISSLDAASRSPDAALQLYQQAGGQLPDAAEVTTKYEHETPDEKSARLAKDRTMMASFGSMLQLHCGLMRFAALFVIQPDLPTLHTDWLAWLNSAAQIYPQLDPVQGESANKTYPALITVSTIRDLTMIKSPIPAYLGFSSWGGKEQGTWSVHGLAKFYRRDVLDPLRQPPVAAVLPAWDAYIAMENANEPDADKWNNEKYPALQFERACDDFSSAPSTEKLQTIVALIQAHPNHPQIEDWISRAHDLAENYRAQKAASAPVPDPANAPHPDAPSPSSAVVTPAPTGTTPAPASP